MEHLGIYCRLMFLLPIMGEVPGGPTILQYLNYKPLLYLRVVCGVPGVSNSPFVQLGEPVPKDGVHAHVPILLNTGLQTLNFHCGCYFIHFFS